MTSFATLLLATATAVSAQTVDRTKPPETPPLAPYKLPAVKVLKLANGLQVKLVEDKRFPLVTLQLAFRAGSRYDPATQTGLAETVAELLTAGTPSRSSRQIAEDLASVGASLNASVQTDPLLISGSVLSDYLPKLIELTADAVRNATFPQDELDLRKQNRAQELRLQRSQADVLARQKVRQVVFGTHPYSRSLPSPESIQSIRRQDLIGFRDRYLVPGNGFLVMVGALPPEAKLLEMLRQHFEKWPAKPVPEAPGGEIPKPARSITLVDRPGSAQSDVLLGHVTPNRLHADYFPLIVGANVLGGGASSRMFMNIREKQGFAYGAYAMNTPYRDAGMLAVNTQVRDEVLEPALQAVFAELDRMIREPVGAQELTNMKNYMNGGFVMSMTSQAGVAAQLANLEINGVPDNYLETYVTRIRSVEPDQIQRVAARYMSPGEASIVIVGDAAKIGKIVEKFGKVTVEKAQ